HIVEIKSGDRNGARCELNLKNIQMPTRIMLWLAAGLLSTTVHAGADGIISDALSPASAGRGGTNLAHSDNTSIIVENPASMASICEGIFDFGGLTLFGNLGYSNVRNQNEKGRTSFPENPGVLPQFGVVLPIQERIRIGFGSHATAGYGTNFDMVSAFAG